MGIDRILFGIRIDNDVGNFARISLVPGDDFAVDDECTADAGRMRKEIDLMVTSIRYHSICQRKR